MFLRNVYVYIYVYDILVYGYELFAGRRRQKDVKKKRTKKEVKESS
jgi:hypothetical protein